MDEELLQFVNYLISLKEKSKSNDLESLIRFCEFFRTDDLELYEEFLSASDINKNISGDKLVELYAKRYKINKIDDISSEYIFNMFINNGFAHGFGYHLANSANLYSIMENGLGYREGGFKTEERKDCEMLENFLPKEVYNKLQIFKSNDLFYSSFPYLEARRYGKKPEWLSELELQKDYLGDGTKEKDLVNAILEKYDKKYNDSHRVLFIFQQNILLLEGIEKLLEIYSVQKIIGIFYNAKLKGKDLSTKEWISPDKLLGIDLKTKDMYCVYGNMGSLNNGDEEIINRRL